MPQTIFTEERFIAGLLARKDSEYFSVPEHRAEFEKDWKEKTGEDYVWEHPYASGTYEML